MINCKLKYGDLVNCEPEHLRAHNEYGKLSNINRPHNTEFIIDHSHYYFGIVDNIWDCNTDTYHKEYDIVSGHGEQKNSKVLIGYRMILDDFTMSNDIYYSDPYNVYYWNDRIDDLIDRMQKDISTSEKIKSIKSKFNREEKLKRILNERYTK